MIILLLGTPIISVQAYTMDMLWSWDNPPDTCIWTSDYDELFYENLFKWENILYDLWGEPALFSIILVNQTTTWEMIEFCEIHLVMVEVEYTPQEFEQILGKAYISNPDDIFLFIYEERNTENHTKSVSQTVLHEFGHALGLNHWIPEHVIEGLLPWPKTTMWAYQIDETASTEIDEYSILALRCLYGDDGFTGKNIERCDSFKTEIPKPEPYKMQKKFYFPK